MNSTRIVPSLDLFKDLDAYKYRMETIFQPPFNGTGYFKVALDDTLKMNVTLLDSQGADTETTHVLYDTGWIG